MQYPLISEYIDAIRSAEDNFDKLSYLRPVLDDNGNPIMSSGNFAVVFKMTDGEKNYAVKCFTREQYGRETAYIEICKYLKNIKSDYLIKVEYLLNELYVDTNQTDETEFPVLLMDWVDGVTLDKYINRYYGNPFELYELCYNFRHMAMWLLDQEFAHGDLKPDNILVQDDGQIILIDYDGMYVPSMEGQNAREKGSPDYRHPFRITSFDRHADDFSLSVICLSLKLISISYGIRNKFNVTDGLLFKSEDLNNIRESALFSYVNELICNDRDLGLYYSSFIKCYSGNILTSNDFKIDSEKNIDDLLDFWPLAPFLYDQEMMEQGEFSNNGIIYNKDGDTVIGFRSSNYNGEDVYIREGTVSICDYAFSDYTGPKLHLHLPSSIRYFSSKSLDYKYKTVYCESPWFTCENGVVYTKDKTECICVLKYLDNAKIDDKVSILGLNFYNDLIFHGVWPRQLIKIRANAFGSTTYHFKLEIPEGVTNIAQMAFNNIDCMYIKLPSTLKSLGQYAFLNCDKLENVEFNDSCSLTIIEESTFEFCVNLKNVHLPKNVTEIRKNAFYGCYSLEQISLPKALEVIGDSSFDMSHFCFSDTFEAKIKRIVFPSKLKYIGKYCFFGQTGLKEIQFTSNIECIDVEAFSQCYDLTNISYSKIKEIRDRVFCDCRLIFPILKGLGEVTPGAFYGCTITINESSNYILESDALYSKNYESLIYYWGKEDIIKLREGIRNINYNVFLHTPKVLILPNSFDLDNINNAHAFPAVIVPSYIQICEEESFSRKEDVKGTYVLSHEMLFVDGNFGVYTEDKTKLLKFSADTNITEYHILEGCIRIDNWAFKRHALFNGNGLKKYFGNKLKEIYIPNSIREIGESAFDGCIEIEELSLPEGLISVGRRAFYRCEKLKTITLPKSVEYVEDADQLFNDSIERIYVCTEHLYNDLYACVNLRNKIVMVTGDVTHQTS